MNEKYFVVTGNEYGVSIPEKIKFLSYDEAEYVYVQKIMEEHEFVGMYKVTEDGIEEYKSEFYE
jgi:hypothetical protein